MSPIDLNCRPALAPHVRLQIDPVSGEPVLLFSEGLLILNPTAQEIVIALGAEYEIDETTLQSDALDCLRDLASRNLVIVKS
jgi:hypothetical protein